MSLTDIRKDLASRIKTVRLLTGASVREFIRMMRVSEPTYRRIVSGRSAVKVENVVALCQSIEVQLADFFSDDFRSVISKLTERAHERYVAAA